MARNKLNKRGSKLISPKALDLKQVGDLYMFYELEKMTDSLYSSRMMRVIYGSDFTSVFTGSMKGMPLPFKK